MTDPYIDADVIIRLLTNDDLIKQAEAATLLDQVKAGKIAVIAPVTVIAEAVYVLSSPRLYNVPRQKVSELLSALVRLPGLKVRHRRAIIRALELYASTHLDFGDAVIVAKMERDGSDILYSYDTHFDRISTITRRSPGTVQTG